MQNIEVKILDHNLNRCMPIFLAQMTQRGHEISSMSDLMQLYEKTINKTPSKYLIGLPHTTIKRMNYMIVAITGLSTKCVSQLRTHATRLTFMSTSTQYSAFDKRPDNYTIPAGLSKDTEEHIHTAYTEIQAIYNKLIDTGVDKDKAGYLLPQGLRKALIIHGNMDAWQYVIQLRLCRRNTEETQYIMRLLYRELHNIAPDWCTNILPTCTSTGCREGKFCCGRKLTEAEVLNNDF